MDRLNWKHIVFFLLALIVIQFLARFTGKQLAENANSGSPARVESPKAGAEIRALVSSQDAEGLTQNDFDLDFLKGFEAYSLERVKANARKYLESRGRPASKVDSFTSEAIYVESGAKKLIVIRFHAPEESDQTLIAGIVGSEMKRVTCIRESKEKISLMDGVCADKIKEVYGVKFGT